MTRILLTAFEPYDRWKENSSWLALIDLTSWYDGDMELVTRRYPVDLAVMRERLQADLSQGFDTVIHLGQSPGASVIQLESTGLNTRSDGTALQVDGPVAYRSSCDLHACHQRLADSGIPSKISHHAGTFLCNATLYLSQHYSAMTGGRSQCLFVHLPLSPAQVAADGSALPSMSIPMQSAAIALIAQALQ